MFNMKPVYDEDLLLEAEISRSEFLVELADILCYHFQVINIDMSREDILKYLEGLLYLRVHYVNKSLPASCRDQYDRAWVMPVLVSQLCSHIGKAVELDAKAIVILPITNLPEPDVDQMISVSAKLRLLGDRGIALATELPRSRDGSYDFMTMNVIQGVVKARSMEVPPVYAFLAAITENRIVEDCFSPRVSYGSTKRYRQFVEQFVTSGLPFTIESTTSRSESSSQGAQTPRGSSGTSRSNGESDSRNGAKSGSHN